MAETYHIQKPKGWFLGQCHSVTFNPNHWPGLHAQKWLTLRASSQITVWQLGNIGQPSAVPVLGERANACKSKLTECSWTAQKASATMHSAGPVKLHVPDPDRKTTSSKGHTAPPHVTDEAVCMSTTPSPVPTHDTDTGIVLVCKSAPLEDRKLKKSANYSKERLVLTIPSPPHRPLAASSGIWTRQLQCCM